MGTRADFYTREKDGKMKWLGSIAWDGYPDGIPESILKTRTKSTYTRLVNKFINGEDSGTKPEDGWPWPWNDSNTTDYAYIFEKDKKVYSSNYGSKWFNPLNPPEDDEFYEGKHIPDFPDMSDIKNVTFGKRSGLIVVSM